MSNKAHKSFFMPIICRFSSNDVVVVKPCKVPDSSSTDPSSPKLSCIGQIKKRSTNINNNENNNYRAKSSGPFGQLHQAPKAFSAELWWLKNRSCHASGEMFSTMIKI
ncbi:hypothetical protein CTI12_AA612610 [Artemisia annua]|uniref:Uncharacterized protein n=1 Tax=Artemisia annua TaxID=35608 RepID=A0A2U1KEW0_ARTAN|nr:hypothetical protein CTI12_AA612610 [Artemisia annua]